MSTIHENLIKYIEDPDNTQLIDSYNVVLKAAQIQENQDVDIDVMLKAFSKLTPTIVNDAGNVMIDLRNFIESAIESYTAANFLKKYTGFGDSTLDLIYYITWLGIEEVIKTVENPQRVFDRFNKGEFKSILWSVSWEDVEEFL